MLTSKRNSVVCLLILFSLFCNIQSNDDDYDDEDELEDCQYEVDFKSYKKSPKLDLCDSLINPTPKSRIQLHIFANHSEEKVHLRAIQLSSSSSSKTNQSLLSLTTDIIEDFKDPTSLLIVDDSQYLSLSTIQSILSSLINLDLKLLGKNLKKTLILVKGGHKQMLSCSGNVYPEQDSRSLNITSAFDKAMTCNKEPQHDRFFTLQERIYLPQVNQKTFQLGQIHQDDSKKISRTSWYTCNNPSACILGLQNKKFLDKTVNYVLKYLQKARPTTKSPSG